MKNVGILGASGRMGQAIVALMPTFPDLQLSVLSARTTESLEKHYAPLSEMFTTTSAVAAQSCDVLIDFSTVSALLDNLAAACKHKTPIVIGTTGLTETHFKAMKKASHEIPLLYAANMSLGVAALNRLVRQAANLLGPDFDIEITESHHRHKVDAPSGTAITLGKTAANARGMDFELNVHTQKRQNNQIGFSVVRGGGIIGDHAVAFISEEESVTLSHRALTRSVFARGSLRAAQWLVDQKPGYYSIDDTF